MMRKIKIADIISHHINPLWRRDLIRFTVSVSSLTVIAIGYFVYQDARSLQLESSKANALLEVKSSVEQIDSWLATRRSEIEAIASSPLIELYQQNIKDTPVVIEDRLELLDWDFFRTDLPRLLASMRVGTDRIRELVTSLRR